MNSSNHAATFSLLMSMTVVMGCATLPPSPDGPPPQEYASLPLPHCTEDMDQADYWIARTKNPDRILLTSEQIQTLNRRNVERGLLTDVFSEKLWDYQATEVDRPETMEGNGEALRTVPGLVHGYTLYTFLKVETERLKHRPRWDEQGQPIPLEVFTALDNNLNLEGIREDNPLRYGLTLRRTNVRYYPSERVITGKRWDVEFDILQVSALQMLQPVAILHESRDRAWVFVVTAYCRGWVLSRDVKLDCHPEEIRRFMSMGPLLVVTGHKIEAFDQPGDTLTAETMYMGGACPLLGEDEEYYHVAVPLAAPRNGPGYRKVYIPRSADVHQGYLPCTVRQIAELAFKQLHHPYDWGGRGEYRDCSQFIMDLFATMGLSLPRNSSTQGQVGSARINFSRRDSLRERQAALDRLDQPALLQFPGHVMLYLGRDLGYYYTIHDIWSYRIPESAEKDRKIIIGKVVVSDLSLGENSNRGSLLERITTVNLLKP